MKFGVGERSTDMTERHGSETSRAPQAAGTGDVGGASGSEATTGRRWPSAASQLSPRETEMAWRLAHLSEDRRRLVAEAAGELREDVLDPASAEAAEEERA